MPSAPGYTTNTHRYKEGSVQKRNEQRREVNASCPIELREFARQWIGKRTIVGIFVLRKSGDELRRILTRPNKQLDYNEVSVHESSTTWAVLGERAATTLPSSSIVTPTSPRS